ncbi:TMV resistance protein N [Glycine soja]
MEMDFLRERYQEDNRNYDVFLSFRGEDTRASFTSHLYTALHNEGVFVFKDDETLPRGNQISPSLRLAIEESRISVVVFSTNYAESRWCLKELENIMECQRTTGQVVVPVFYGVYPSKVRHQTGDFGKAFRNLEENRLLKVKEEKLLPWLKTLAEAAGISGLSVVRNCNGREALRDKIDLLVEHWREALREAAGILGGSVSELGKMDIANLIDYFCGALEGRTSCCRSLHALIDLLVKHWRETLCEAVSFSDGANLYSSIGVRQFARLLASWGRGNEACPGDKPPREALEGGTLGALWHLRGCSLKFLHVSSVEEGIRKDFEVHVSSVEEVIIKDFEVLVIHWTEALHEAAAILRFSLKMPLCNNLNVNNPPSTLNLVQDPMSLFYANPNENPAASIVSSPLTVKIATEEINILVKGWAEALREAASISGIVVLKPRNESEAIQTIVKNVKRLLDKTEMSVAEYPVGVEPRVQEMIELLDQKQSNDVLLLGMWGMGGIGKTTIAKAIYNKIGRNFEGKSFLEQIRKVWGEDAGQVHLQEQLLFDITKETNTKIRNVESGKVTIIITTRDMHIIRGRRVDKVFRMKGMDEDESIELFSWHAFKQASPREDFIELSRNVVAYSAGLPLALEVLGSYLFDMEVTEWKNVLEKLKKIPNDEVQEKLKISYDGLTDDTEKGIFLDIACFFIGMDRNDVIHILNGCGLCAENGIRVLVERSLVTVDYKNKLGMHDLLRDMGREIIRSKTPMELEERSRLWFHEDALDVLSKETGTKAIEGLALKLPRNNTKCLSTKAFKEMKKLRLLQFAGVQLVGDFTYLSKDLRWLCWHGFPLACIPTNLYQGSLVSIELENSNVNLLWKEAQNMATSDGGGCLLPGDSYPDWLTFNTEGSSVTFEIPQVKGRNLKKMMCHVHYSSPENITSDGLKNLLVINHTKAIIQLYKRNALVSFEDEEWQGVLSKIEPGNKVQIVVVFWSKLTVCKTTIYLIYEPMNEKIEHSHAPNKNVMDSSGDENECVVGTISLQVESIYKPTNDIMEHYHASSKNAIVSSSDENACVVRPFSPEVESIDDLRCVSKKGLIKRLLNKFLSCEYFCNANSENKKNQEIGIYSFLFCEFPSAHCSLFSFKFGFIFLNWKRIKLKEYGIQDRNLDFFWNREIQFIPIFRTLFVEDFNFY